MTIIRLFLLMLQLCCVCYLTTSTTTTTPVAPVQLNLPPPFTISPETTRTTTAYPAIWKMAETATFFTTPTSRAAYVDGRVSQHTWHPEVEISEGQEEDNAEILYHKHRFEGDIVLANHSVAVTDRNANITEGKDGSENEHNDYSTATMLAAVLYNAARQKTLLWQGGRVPYSISSEFPNMSKLIILEAFEQYHLRTCIQFVPKEPQDLDFIDFIPDDGCYSMVGNNGGKQAVSLGNGCLRKGIIIHEMMHVLGFFHEQSRPDRDSYVDIHWENVDPTLTDQFDKYSATMVDDLGAPYDYGSVMHYAPTAFSKNGERTITPIAGNEHIEIGQRRGFSPLDVWKINKLYNCSDYLVTSTSTITKPMPRKWKKRKRRKKRPMVQISGSARSFSVAIPPTTIVPSTIGPFTASTTSIPVTTKNNIITTTTTITITTTTTTTRTTTTTATKTTTTSPLPSTTTATATISGFNMEFVLPTPFPLPPPPTAVIDLKSLLNLFGPLSIAAPSRKTTTAAVTTTTITPTSDNTSTTPQQIGQCRDRHSECKTLADRGFCQTYPHFMHDYCARICGQCTDHCTDRVQWCPSWVRAGMCTSKAMGHFMSKNCARSCGRC